MIRVGGYDQFTWVSPWTELWAFFGSGGGGGNCCDKSSGKFKGQGHTQLHTYTATHDGTICLDKHENQIS